MHRAATAPTPPTPAAGDAAGDAEAARMGKAIAALEQRNALLEREMERLVAALSSAHATGNGPAAEGEGEGPSAEAGDGGGSGAAAPRAKSQRVSEFAKAKLAQKRQARPH